jgi:hypothetical protein
MKDYKRDSGTRQATTGSALHEIIGAKGRAASTERRQKDFRNSDLMEQAIKDNSTSNIEILERFLSKALRMITDAPWYVPNAGFRRDLHIPSVKEEIQRLSSRYSARLNSHPNLLTANLKKQTTYRRLRRILPTDPPTRFLV